MIQNNIAESPISSLTGIHCKVIYEDEIRRFSFEGTEFSSLRDQIKKVCSIEKEFVLKYKDDEGDMITLSTDAELSFAIATADSSRVLRLSASPVETSCPERSRKHRHDHGRGHWRGRAGRDCGAWRGKCRRTFDGAGQREMKVKRIQNWIDRLSKIPKEEGDYEKRQEKIQKLRFTQVWLLNHPDIDTLDEAERKIHRLSFIIDKLSQIPKEEGNFAIRQRKIEKLQKKKEWIKSNPEEFKKSKERLTWGDKKIARINKCIERMESIPNNEGNFEKRKMKIANLRQKLENIKNHPQGCPKVPLSDAEKENIQKIKEKIISLQEIISVAKFQIKEKRGEMKSTFDDARRQILFNEIEALKCDVESLKVELQGLRKEICQSFRRNQ
jgi:hypothetical protein